MTRVWDTTPDGRFEFVTITSDILEAALDVIRVGFCLNETVSIATGVNKSPEAIEDLVLLSRATAADGVSLAAIDKATGRVASVAFNKIQWKLQEGEKPFFESFPAHFKHESSKALVKFMADVDNKVDLFEEYKIDCVVELMFLATHPDFRKNRLAEGITKATLKLAATEKPRSPHGQPAQAVCAMFTSKISQKIGVALNFDQVIEISYDEFMYQGKTFKQQLNNTEISTILVAKRV